MTDWSDDAACAGVDPDLFFPDEGEHPTEALAICAVCPVRAECLEEAIRTDERHGVWGGMTARQRNRARRGHRVYGRLSPKVRRDHLSVRARLIAADARRHGLDPVQAVATRLVLSIEESRDLLERSPLD